MPILTSKTYNGTAGQPIYGGLQAPPPNELRISLPTGTQTNYPFQFGRAFAPGAIVGEPAVALDGVQLAQQQADIKTRYEDGTVKFAVISVIIPSLSTTERVLSISNKAAAVRQPETVANMLANYDFNATIDIKQSGTSWANSPVSARTFLSTLSDATLAANTTAHSPNARYWTQGPVCTTVILCDHTTKSLDFGSTAARCMRPMFYVEFWPSIGRYKVRHVIENADVSKLRGETAMNVIFTTGNTAPVEQLNQASVALPAETWDSREFWHGAAVPTANCKHGIAYLAGIGVVSNFDTSITMNQQMIAGYGSGFAAMDKRLGANGSFTKGMPTSGGRAELGVFTRWETVMLYDGAAALHQTTTQQCEFAGRWPIYWREGLSDRTYIDAVNGLGRPVTIFGRPTQFNAQKNGQYTLAADQWTFDGPGGDIDGWIPDDAHFPSLFYTTYLTTGGAFWYEKMQQVAAYGMFFHQPALAYNVTSRGDSLTRMLLNNVQVRGFAWQYRNRARAWWASLDGSPDRTLLTRAMDEATASRCGIYDIDEFVGNPVREAWNTNQQVFWGNVVGRPNALGFMVGDDGYTTASIGGVWPNSSNQTSAAPWMINFAVAGINHAVELGYTRARKLRDFAARSVLQIAVSTQPRMAGFLAIPAGKVGGAFYQSAAELIADWPGRDFASGDIPATSANGYNAGGVVNTPNVTVFDYANHAAFAVASANGNPGQAAAWGFFQPYHQNTVFFNHDPRTAVIPRA